MIRGTTAQFKFKLPYPKEKLEWATIRFWQPGNMHQNLPITKTLDECDAPADSTELCVSLTVDETMRFSEKRKAKVQLRAQLKKEYNGTVFGSRTKLFTVYPTYDESSDLPIENEDGFIILDGETVVG